jgi:hypothetical protein
VPLYLWTCNHCGATCTISHDDADGYDPIDPTELPPALKCWKCKGKTPTDTIELRRPSGWGA